MTRTLSTQKYTEELEEILMKQAKKLESMNERLTGQGVREPEQIRDNVASIISIFNAINH